MTEQDLYYLKSILRNLIQLRELSTEIVEVRGWGIGNEVLADNIHWLECFIDQKEREDDRLRQNLSSTATEIRKHR